MCVYHGNNAVGGGALHHLRLGAPEGAKAEHERRAPQQRGRRQRDRVAHAPQRARPRAHLRRGRDRARDRAAPRAVVILRRGAAHHSAERIITRRSAVNTQQGDDQACVPLRTGARKGRGEGLSFGGARSTAAARRRRPPSPCRASPRRACARCTPVCQQRERSTVRAFCSRSELLWYTVCVGGRFPASHTSSLAAPSATAR